MKILLLIILSISSAYSQSMDKKISQLFFEMDLNQSPDLIVKNSNLLFELSANKTVGKYLYLYTANFEVNEFIKSKLKSGRIDVKFDKENLGYFEVIQVLEFTNEMDLTDEYEKLTKIFEEYSSKTVIESSRNENQEIDFRYTKYQEHKKNAFPNLSFAYSKQEENRFFLIITFMNRIK